MYSAEEAARILGLQVRTVRNYVREGRLPGVRIGKQYRIARADLEAFTTGGVTLEAIVGPKDDTAARLPARAAASVSSVVEVDGIDAAARESLERTLAAMVVAASDAGSLLRVEPLYDDARRRLRLIIVGEVAETAELLRIIDRFTAHGGSSVTGGVNAGGPLSATPLTAPGSPGAW